MNCTDCKFYENECESHFQQELIGRKRTLEICEIFYPKEPRFIEAYSLIEDLKAAEANGGMGSVVARTLMRYVKRCKTVDAVEVVHGRWIKNWCNNSFIGHEYAECSVCDCHMLDTNQFWNSNYCPNCGAKMDGDGNDTDC